MPRLLGGAHHRHHHAERADVERASDEGVFAARHPHHRDDAESAAQRELVFQRLEAQSRVLHVEHHVIRAGVAADLREASREALENHRAERRSARGQRTLDGIVANHRAIPVAGTGWANDVFMALPKMLDNRADAANVRCAVAEGQRVPGTGRLSERT